MTVPPVGARADVERVAEPDEPRDMLEAATRQRADAGLDPPHDRPTDAPDPAPRPHHPPERPWKPD